MRAFSTSFVQRFLAFCQENALLDTDSVLVAFSGGADSTVLLSLLANVCRQRQIRLGALHVHHKIRGREADEDAAFCRAFCEERAIPFYLVERDVPTYAAQNKLGLEEAARKLRYEALAQTAQNEAYRTLATAHNATDQLETLLFHLVRGSALRGGGGMAPCANGLIRPLLPFTKNEILTYARENALAFCQDSTNADTAYTRNYIRHEILPHLYRLNPRAEEAALRFTKAAREDDAYLYQQAASLANVTSLKTLAALDDALLNRVLLIKWRENAHNEITSAHLAILRKALRKAAEGNFVGRLSLPGKIAAQMQNDTLTFVPDTRCKKPKEPEEAAPIPLLLEKDCLFREHYRVKLTAHPDPNADFTVFVDPTQLNGTPFVRSRQEGDLYPLGGLERRVKKLLNAYRIPQEERPFLPFICDGDGILFIPHLPKSDRLKTKCENKDVYYIQITKNHRNKKG